jgi:hypothetical protein
VAAWIVGRSTNDYTRAVTADQFVSRVSDTYQCRFITPQTVEVNGTQQPIDELSPVPIEPKNGVPDVTSVLASCESQSGDPIFRWFKDADMADVAGKQDPQSCLLNRGHVSLSMSSLNGIGTSDDITRQQEAALDGFRGWNRSVGCP